MQKTLGGDRLGSGKKMKVDMHGYSRSTHDMGYIFRSTMASGTLIPFIVEVALPGDTFDIDLDSLILTHPTIGPLMGSYKMQADVFTAGIRLYQGKLHNNPVGIGMKMQDVKLPELVLTAIPTEGAADIDNAQINPSCILSYLGIRGVGIVEAPATSSSRSFNGIPLLMYWDIYKNYYANKQEGIGAVIHTPIVAINKTVLELKIEANILPLGPPDENLLELGSIPGEGRYYKIYIEYLGARPRTGDIMFNTSIGYLSAEQLTYGEIVDTGTVLEITYNFPKYGLITTVNWRYREPTDEVLGQPGISTFPLESIDNMRNKILAHAVNASAFNIRAQDIPPYNLLLEASLIEDKVETVMNKTQEGLALKTHQSDLFNNWLKTEWIEGPGGISEVTAVDTSSGSFTMDQLNLSQKVYNMLNRIQVSGGTYEDWMSTVYDHEQHFRAETPVYQGGLIKELVFEEVISTAQSIGEGGQPLGTLAGRGKMGRKHKGGSIYIKVNEPSYIMGIVSLTPRVDYSQGNKWDTGLETMDDLHKPALDEIGFQDDINEQRAWWTTHLEDGVNWVQKSAGKLPAWVNYQTNVNRVYGNFANINNEGFMVLLRRYEYDEIEKDIKDLTTYIDPAKFNFIFAETSIDSQNFWMQIAIDMIVRRKMSAKIIPNL